MTRRCPVCTRDDFRSELALRNHMQQNHQRKWKHKYSNQRELNKNLLREWRKNVDAKAPAQSNEPRGQGQPHTDTRGNTQ